MVSLNAGGCLLIAVGYSVLLFIHLGVVFDIRGWIKNASNSTYRWLSRHRLDEVEGYLCSYWVTEG